MKKDIKTVNQIQNYARKSIDYISAHIIVIMAMLIGGTIAYASLTTKSQLNVSRNETKYNEEVVKIDYKMIDEEILNSFQVAGEDNDVSVDTNFDPNRENPFSE